MKLKEFVYKIIPKYSILPLTLVVVFNFAVFYGTRLLPRNYYDLSLPIDAKIPLITAFIVPYVLAYVQWISGFIVVSREDPKFSYKYFASEIIAKFITLIFFIALPTTIIRPEIKGTGFFPWATRFIYSVDIPDNLFPSVHCLESWFCLRTAFQLKRLGKFKTLYVIISIIMTALVFMSVVFVKQHFFIDVIAGVLVMEVGIFLNRFIKLDKHLYNLYLKISNKISTRGKTDCE